jgi:membrane protease YdiL (CAAX protease family)
LEVECQAASSGGAAIFLLPYALLGVGALLAIAFWWVYRPLAACAGGTCNPRSRRTLRWIVWAAGVLVAGLAVVALGPE